MRRGLAVLALAVVSCGGTVAATDTRGTSDQRDAGDSTPPVVDAGPCRERDFEPDARSIGNGNFDDGVHIDYDYEGGLVHATVVFGGKVVARYRRCGSPGILVPPDQTPPDPSR